MSRILIVEDDPRIRRTLVDIVGMQGYEVEEAGNGKIGLQLILDNRFDLVLSDIQMPEMDGMALLAQAREKRADLPFIMLTAHATIEKAVEALKLGAYDFLEKPPQLQKLMVSIRNVLDHNRLIEDNRRMKSTIDRIQSDIPPFLGESRAMDGIRKILDRAAPSDSRILITGEAGTGKELVARWVHHLSNRSDAPFIAVNCAAIPPELIESELFGHEKGSFTGAAKQHIGCFEQADGGTLFLDEIGDMSLAAQAKVLRALQENQIRRVGGDRDIKVDARIVAATNKDLEAAMEDGSFRDDLFHRLSVIRITVPPLRERTDDIALLAGHFCLQISTRNGGEKKTLTDEAMNGLRANPWRGNVRELQNAVERLVVLSEGSRITKDDVDLYISAGKAPADSITHLVNSYEKIADFRDAAETAFLKRKLEEFEWNISRTSDAIDLQRSNLYAKLKKYGLEK